jgi:hypothetical protein
LPNLPSHDGNTEGADRADTNPVSPGEDRQSLGLGSFGGTAGLATPFHSNSRQRPDLQASTLRSHRRRSLSSVPEVGCIASVADALKSKPLFNVVEYNNILK